MIICTCKAIREKDIQKLHAEYRGLLTLEILKQELGCGTDCGSCLSSVLEQLNDNVDCVPVGNFNKSASA